MAETAAFSAAATNISVSSPHNHFSNQVPLLGYHFFPIILLVLTNLYLFIDFNLYIFLLTFFVFVKKKRAFCV